MTASARLHPQVEELRLELLAAGNRPLHELTVGEAREAERLELRPAVAEPVAEVVDRTLPGPAGEIGARFYLPDTPEPGPAFVYFHGGGWVLGSLDAVDAVCRRLANAAGFAVVSVDYRLAPEHPFPGGLDDCYAAIRWVAEHGSEHGLDRDRLAVGGASAGGNLAAAVTLLARRQGPPLLFQLLVYPPLDHRAATGAERMRLDRPFFSAEDLAWCWRNYLGDEEDGESPLASPLRAVDLRGLPPALLITAELDPLCDEAELYAARLREANVPARLARFDGVAHGFFSLSERLDAAAEAQALAASALRDAFAHRVAQV
jgi:acetyl esterase/lipase